MKVFWYCVVLWISIDPVLGQIKYTASFTRSLEKAGISYIAPLEQWLHVAAPPDHEYMQYDLVLQNDRNDFEVRYRIHPNRRSELSIPPSVTVSRLIASIASNDEANEIRVVILSEEILKVFNADRGVIAYFTPKDEFTEKPYGAVFSLYAEDRRAIDVVLLYTNPEFDPLTAYRSIYFRE